MSTQKKSNSRSARRRRNKAIARQVVKDVQQLDARSALRSPQKKGFSLGIEKLTLPGGVGLGKGTIEFRKSRAASLRARAIRSGSVTSGGPSGTVGVAPHSLNIQARMPTMSTEFRGDVQVDVLSGTEFLDSVASPALGNLAGDILVALLINPMNFPTTRIRQFAPLYQRYRFRHFNVLYEPIANATQSGQLIGYNDYDVDSLLEGDTEANVSVAAAHLGQAICQIWEPQCFPLGVVDDYTTLFTSLEGPEDRLIYQGIFYLIAASTLGNDLPLGNIMSSTSVSSIFHNWRR